MCYCSLYVDDYCPLTYHLPHRNVEFLSFPLPQLFLEKLNGTLCHRATTLAQVKEFVWNSYFAPNYLFAPPLPATVHDLARRDLVSFYIIRASAYSLTAAVFYSMAIVAIGAIIH